MSISASACRIDLATHKSLAIEAGDADLALVLGEAERVRPLGVMCLPKRPQPGVSKRSARAPVPRSSSEATRRRVSAYAAIEARSD